LDRGPSRPGAESRGGTLLKAQHSPADRILAIDPGSAKCGLALLEADGRVVEKAVLELGQLAERVQQTLEGGTKKVVLGGGTGSKSLAAVLKPICQASGATLVMVAESHSTQMARLLYFRENPPQGWRRLLPASFQIPPRPYDDYGAIVIGRRYLEGGKADV